MGEKISYEELKELMEKINVAMVGLKGRQVDITNKEKSLYEETAILKVEKGKEELKNLKDTKQEFDEMTMNSIEYARKQISSLLEELNDGVKDTINSMLEKKKDIEHKYESFKEKDLTDDKLAMVEKSFRDNMNKVDNDMKKFQLELLEKKNKLSEYERDISQYEYAIKSGNYDDIKLYEGIPDKKLRNTYGIEPEKEPISSETEDNKDYSKIEKDDDIGEKIKNVEEQMKLDNRDYSKIHLQKNPPPYLKEISRDVKKSLNKKSLDKLKINIGRKGKISFNGKTYRVGRNVIKEGVNLTRIRGH